jgi:c(7)-type cytochrome triheme protein
MRWLAAVVIGALMFGCSPVKLEKEKTEKAPEKIITRSEAVGSLPCFKCHSYPKFSATPQKGIFAHSKHLDAGFHCNQCHDFEGHKHITVKKDACGACHNIKGIAFNKTAVPSQFSHDAHAKRSGCGDCHPATFIMKAGAASVTMKDINKGAYCGACHNGKKAFSAGECAKCHPALKNGFNKDLTYKSDMGDVEFSHKFHTAMFSCDECHPKRFAMKKTHGKMKMDDMYQGKFCGDCHNGSMAFAASECMKCHKH